MIYTLTPNPAVDMNVRAKHVTTHKVNRTTDAVYSANGKGLNVSFTLAHFGIQAPILGFFGGFSGRYIVEEAQHIAPVHPLWVDGITRVNTFVTTPEGEYKFPNAGAPVPRTSQDELLKLLKQLPDLAYLVVSGSLPPGITPDFYAELQAVCADRNAQIILDMSDKSLAEHIKRRPFLIKPNDEELNDIFGMSCDTQEHIVANCSSLLDQGAQHILLTLGDKGAYFARTYEGSMQLWRACPPRVELVSSACAGDATLGSFLSVFLSGDGSVDCAEQALRRAMAVGANVAASAGLGSFSRVEELEQQVEIERIV